MAPRRTKAKELSRKVSTRPERRTIVVFCEGSASEPDLILHYSDQSAFMNTAEAEKRSRKLDGRDGKRIDAATYLPHRLVAAQRASALAERHRRNGTEFPQDNPSSTMFELLVAVQALPGRC